VERRSIVALALLAMLLAFAPDATRAASASHRAHPSRASRTRSVPRVPDWTPPPASDVRLAALAPVIGQPQSEMIGPDETVLDIAWQHRLGFDRLARLNPEVKVWIPDPGTVVRLPTEHVLPDKPWHGLVINVPEMQLYDFSQPGTPEPDVFAIAIGDQMDPSLVGEYRVGRKREHPVWTVPASIRAEKPELPPVVPAGPDNPLGDHWMTIGNTTYGIHGTNNHWSIGREATHGCVRLYNDEMERLYARTREGTPIRLVYQTVKVGQRDGTVYVEAHPDLYQREPPDRAAVVLEKLAALGLAEAVDASLVRKAIDEERGIPVPVGTLATHPGT
jgi:L,D-transpeptidase ErfK/SrfK